MPGFKLSFLGKFACFTQVQELGALRWERPTTAINNNILEWWYILSELTEKFFVIISPRTSANLMLVESAVDALHLAGFSESDRSDPSLQRLIRRHLPGQGARRNLKWWLPLKQIHPKGFPLWPFQAHIQQYYLPVLILASLPNHHLPQLNQTG